MFGRSAITWLPAGLALLLALATADAAFAHRLNAEYQISPGKKVRISSWYSTPGGEHPAAGAKVTVSHNDKPFFEGTTDKDGVFEFSCDRAETLRVEVYQAGHLAKLTVAAAEFGREGESSPQNTPSTQEPTETPRRGATAEHDPSAWIKEVLIGVGFLLALAAFVLSLRNARELRRLKRTTPPR
jgi:hypothetical protein